MSGSRLRAAALVTATALAVAVPMSSASATDSSGAGSSKSKSSAAGDCVVGQAGWRAPVQQRYVITSPFGDRDNPISHKYRLHAGVDLAMQPGPGPVVAADAGTVVRSGPYGGLGNEVTIQHANGVQTLYGHMAHIAADITPGSKVQAGQVLGKEGSTGASTGPHLHFEVHVNGKPVNPVPFMKQHNAPLDGRAPAPVTATPSAAGFALPAAGTPRKASLHQGAMSIPPKLMQLYRGAGEKYGVPWALLAGIGMEETAQGRNNTTSSAGAMGLMQFLPSTFAHYGVDGDGDGKVDIHSDADSVYSAANLLRAVDVAQGAAGVRRALFAYNHAEWYVNDVLYYAAAYGKGAGGVACTDGAETAASSRAAGAVRWAESEVGHAYRFGANGPDAWDSSSFVQAAYKNAGVQLPRTAQQQRDWLAAGHGTRVQPGDERPGDLIFEDSYLGPGKVGFVMIVTDPQSQRAVAARTPTLAVSYATYAGAQHTKHIFEVWRVNAPR
ncbi:peptidoglycan DD-metalloendopeptidase family protein [Flexivirga sp. B27]